MLQIMRRDDSGMTRIATYRDGEFHGDERLAEAFADEEGAPEERIMEIFDGPDYVALRPEGETAPESG